MKARLLLIPVILATTVTIADTPSTSSDRTDAQARAAALLSRPHTPATNSRSNPSPVESTKGDAHARAAALLRPQRTEGTTTPVPVARGMVIYVDAHEHAAALLSGPRISRQVQQRAQQTRVGAPASGQTF
jgi:hypothetical protein